MAPRVGGAGSAGGTSPARFRGRGHPRGGRGGGGRGGGGRGGNSDGGRSVGGLRSASSEDGAEPPPVQEGDAEPPRVPTTDAEWEKLNAAQFKYFETWKPIASGGAAQLNKARHLMTQLSNVRGSHVKDANVAIAAIHVKHHPAVFPMALSFYSIPSAGGAPDAAAVAATCSPIVRGGFSHSSESHMRIGRLGAVNTLACTGRPVALANSTETKRDRLSSATGHSGWAWPFSQQLSHTV